MAVTAAAQTDGVDSNVDTLTAQTGADTVATAGGEPQTAVIDTDSRETALTGAGIDTETPDTAQTAADSAAAPAKKNEVTDTVFYEADFVEYDNDERVLELHGRAIVRYQNISLTADTIVYTVSNDQFQAKGKPMLIDGGDTTVGDFMVYNIKTRRGRVSYAVTRFDDTYVTGSNIVKTPDNCLYIEQGDYTTCQNPEHPHYFFYGKHIKVVPNDMAITRPVVLNIGDAPIAALPYMIMPLERGRRSGWLTPSWGGSVSRGGYVDNLGYYLAPNDYYDLALSTKVQEFNSFVFSGRGRYALRYVLDGQVSGRYVVDNRLESSSQQWSLDYRHNQFLTPDGRTRLSGQGSVLSNRTFNRLYSDNTRELEQQQMNANMSLSHRFESINASSNITWRRNHNLTTDRIIEDIPSFDFNLQNRAFVPFKPGGSQSEPSWYNNIYYSYNTKANVRRDVYGNDSLPGFIRPGMEHNVNLSSSQKILRYLDVSPFFNMRASMFYGAMTLPDTTGFDRDTVIYYVRDPSRDTRWPDYTLIDVEGPKDSINRNAELDTFYIITKVSPFKPVIERDTLDREFNVVRSWNTGVNLSTRIYGMFPTGGLLGVTAIRHTLSPTVGYTFMPKHELDRTFYDIGVNYDRPREKAQQLVNFSLSNTFQGKRIVRRSDKKAPPRPNAGITGDKNSGGTGGISVIDEKTDMGDNDELSAGMDNDGDINDTTGAGVDTSATAGNRQPPADNNAPREQKFDILSLSLSTSYDFEADARKWRDLSLSARTGVSALNVNFSSTFWLYDQKDELSAPIMRNYSVDLTSRSLGVAGKFWDGDLLDIDIANFDDPLVKSKINTHSWNVSFSPSFSYRASRATPDDRFLPVKSFNLSSSANVNLTPAMSVRWSGNYDFSSNQFSHNNYTIHYDLECWEMRFTWRPEKINPGFHFVVNIKKLPDIKWEEKESRTTRVL